jgi:hypothetical protein|nr:MAG TPA: hypothetical protein [Caudoviricetes sp.]
MNKTQIKELQGAIVQMNATDRTKSTFTIEDNFVYFTPEGHRGYKINVNILSEAVEEIPKSNYSRTIPDIFNAMATYGINQINIKQSDLLQLARQHKKENSKTPFIFEYHEKNYGFQSKYIIDALKTLGTKSKTYISNEEKDSKLYIESEIGVIIILPMRLNINGTLKADYTE